MRLHADLKMKVLLGNRQAKLDCLGIMHIDLDENNFRFSIECSYRIINIFKYFTSAAVVERKRVTMIDTQLDDYVTT